MYSFGGGSKIAVFTWQGCLLELRGKTEAAYVARETPMIIYLNTHAGLEQVIFYTMKYLKQFFYNTNFIVNIFLYVFLDMEES